MIQDTQQTKPKKIGFKTGIVVGIILVIVVGLGILYYIGTKTPNVEVLDIEAERYGTSLFSDSCRATITATIRNAGDIDAYVTVKLTIEWAGESHSDVDTVFVKAHSTSNAVGDVQATIQWFNYKAEIIEVRSA